MPEQYIPVLLTFGFAVMVAIGIFGISALAGQRSRHSVRRKLEAYESGVPLIDTGLKRISVRFYIVAIVFLVLDVEVAFLYPWAVTYREFLDQNAVTVLWDMLAFVTLIGFAYVYLWKKGVFDWGRRRTPVLGEESEAGGEG
jgi:NADH:ubiquinone oxidoreductase subunit 3 (subunit A)